MSNDDMIVAKYERALRDVMYWTQRVLSAHVSEVDAQADYQHARWALTGAVESLCKMRSRISDEQAKDALVAILPDIMRTMESMVTV